MVRRRSTTKASLHRQGENNNTKYFSIKINRIIFHRQGENNVTKYFPIKINRIILHWQGENNNTKYSSIKINRIILHWQGVNNNTKSFPIEISRILKLSTRKFMNFMYILINQHPLKSPIQLLSSYPHIRLL